MEELYTPKDVARILGITEYTVREKLKEKEIPGFRLYGRWKIRPEELRRYIQQQQDKQR
jgi:excisionase family DNA binding protein